MTKLPGGFLNKIYWGKIRAEVSYPYFSAIVFNFPKTSGYISGVCDGNQRYFVDDPAISTH